MYTDAGAGASNGWRYYNNSILDCDRANNGIYNTGCGGFAFAGSAYIHNTLFYRAWADAATVNPLEPWGGFGAGNTGTITADYNLAFDPGGTVSFGSSWTGQDHEQSNVDPQLSDVANADYTLRAESGARGVGGPLTTASGDGSNSTSLTVAPSTGSFFIGDDSIHLPQYGGQLVPGDFITVGSTPAQVVSVSGDVLALASPISWHTGDPVYFGTGSPVDIGAYPYKAGGYALAATSAIDGATATITPDDPSLVRFVVCYSDGVPYAVDNSSPYTCAVPDGTFSARVYPRYPSETLWVSADAGDGNASGCGCSSAGGSAWRFSLAPLALVLLVLRSRRRAATSGNRSARDQSLSRNANGYVCAAPSHASNVTDLITPATQSPSGLPANGAATTTLVT
jgi:MYXO-CTERM domain-containing protein